MNEYPTEEELQKIKEWKANDFHGLLNYVDDIYNHDFGIIDRNIKEEWILITGGWSGNEDIICSLSDNMTWWANYWESSHRGGKYVFRKKD